MIIKNRTILRVFGFIPKDMSQKVMVSMPIRLWALCFFKHIFSPMKKSDYRL